MVICLDAGHSGEYNPYLISGQIVGWESKMTWDLCQKLAKRLNTAGVTVLQTRDTFSEDPDLISRGRTAQGCDLFLSIHSNGGGGGTADYPLACCSVDGTADGIGFALADAVRRAMDTAQPARLWKRDYQTGIGTMLYSTADPEFGKRTHPLDYYGVLRGAAQVGVPGVLLECSFHDHPKMVQFLTDNASLEHLADAICQALLDFYGIPSPDFPFEEAPAEDTAEEIDWQERYNALLEALTAVLEIYRKKVSQGKIES